MTAASLTAANLDETVERAYAACISHDGPGLIYLSGVGKSEVARRLHQRLKDPLAPDAPFPLYFLSLANIEIYDIAGLVMHGPDGDQLTCARSGVFPPADERAIVLLAEYPSASAPVAQAVRAYIRDALKHRRHYIICGGLTAPPEALDALSDAADGRMVRLSSSLLF